MYVAGGKAVDAMQQELKQLLFGDYTDTSDYIGNTDDKISETEPNTNYAYLEKVKYLADVSSVTIVLLGRNCW